MTTQPHDLSNIDDEQILAEFRRRFPALEKAPYPKPVFQMLNEYRPAITFEAVIWRKAGESYDVLLRERSASEDYPLVSHVNGSYMLQRETSVEALARIVTTEVGSNVKIISSEYAGILFDRFELRGPQVHIIYVLTIEGEVTGDSLHWEPLENLGSVTNLLGYHRDLLEKIALPVISGAHQPALTYELSQGLPASKVAS